MNFPSHIFRGYDIRALVDSELSNENVEIIAKAYATFLYRRQIRKCVIGYDCRETSPHYANIFANILKESGFEVVDFGLGLTQIMYFAQYRFLSKGGVFVTASHNSVEYNGFKLATGFSETLITSEMEELKEIALSGDFKKYDNEGNILKVDVFSDYKKDLFDKAPIKMQNFKVVIDASNATTGKFLPEILKEAGCEVIEQNTEIKPDFPLGTPDPTEKSVLERLSKRVLAEKADMGVAYDSDGDRVGVVDSDGNLIWNDVLVAIFARDILHFLPKSSIIFNTLCSKAVLDVIDKEGGNPVMWLTGHSFIKAKVREERSPFGGELSGHFYFTDNFYGHDDGAITTLRLFQFLNRTKKSLKEVVAEIPQYFSSPEVKLGIPEEIKFDFIKNEMSKLVKEILPNANYIEIDGTRADTDTQMLIIRASQNGAYFTIKFEGKTQEEYDNLKKVLGEKLKNYKEIDWSKGVNIDIFD